MTGIITQKDFQTIKMEPGLPTGSLRIGNIIDAKVLDQRDSGTDIDFGSGKITLPKSLGIVEAVGENALFQVVKSGKKPELRYMRPDSDVRSFSNVENQKSGLKVLKSYEEILAKSKNDMSSEDRNKVDQLVVKTQATIQNLTENMSDADIRTMLQDGFDPSKAGVALVAQVMTHNKPFVRERDFDQLEVQVKAELDKLIDRYGDEANIKDIAQALDQAGLAVNKRHIDKVLGAQEALEAVMGISNEKAADLLKQVSLQAGEGTLSEAYKWSQSPVNKQDMAMTEENLTAMVKTYLEEMGMDTSEDDLEGARLLVSRGVPLTPESLAFVKSPEHFLRQISPEDYLEDMAEAMAEGKSPKDMVLTLVTDIFKEDSETEAESGRGVRGASTSSTVTGSRISELSALVVKVGQLTDLDLMTAVARGQHKTLDQTVAVMGDSDHGIGAIKPDDLEAFTREAVTFKKNLSEIQLKMTLEVALRMERQGISVDTAPVEEVVRRLEAEETALAAVRVKAYSDEPSIEKNLEETLSVKRATEELAGLSRVSGDVIGKLMASGKNISVSDLTETNQKVTEDAFRESLEETVGIRDMRYALSEQLARASYEGSLTVVRPDLGDRIERTFPQIEAILRDLSIPATDANISAVQSLARNAMAITEENVLEIQILQEKISQIVTGLTPTLVVKMVHAGMVPTDMGIDELLSVMEAYKEEGGTGSLTKISELIHALDREGSLTEDQRSRMMAVYRTLDTVTRSKGGAIGFIVKNNLSLTMDSLFEAAKYIRKTRHNPSAIRGEVGDGFGFLEKIVNKEEMIHNQRGTGGDLNLLRKELMDLRISAFVQVLQPENAKLLVSGGGQSTANDTKDMGQLPLEALTKLLQDQSQSSSVDAQSYLKAISVRPELIRHMVEKGLPMTMVNFEKVMALDKQAFLLMDELEKMVAGIRDSETRNAVTDKLIQASEGVLKGDLPYEALKTALEEAEALIRYGAEDQNPAAYKGGSEAKATVSNIQMLQVSEDYFQIPVFIEEHLSQLNMYILNQGKMSMTGDSELKVLMNFEAGSMGEVKVLLSLKGKKAVMQIDSTYEEDRPLLKAFQKGFETLIADTDMVLGGVIYEPIDVKEPVKAKDQATAVKQAYNIEKGHIDWTV